MTDTTLIDISKQASWRDYYDLCKPRVVMLMLLCSIVGMFLATPGIVEWQILLFGNLGIALVAGSAAAVNHLVDAEVDAKMARTRNRPIVQGRVDKRHAVIFAGITGIAGVSILVTLVNPLTAWLNLASWFGYGIFYSMYLKHATPQNIVIGGLFGAAPPLFGWTAVTNSIDPGGILLVLIITAWTPPHFWALAIDRKEEYAKTDVPILPITHGVAYTKRLILLYTFVLVAISTLPYVIEMSNLIYLVSALLLGAGFIYWSLVLLAGNNDRAPIETFRYSILYLMALFVALLLDHYIMPL